MQELPPNIRVITPQSAYRYLGMTRRDATGWKDQLGRAFYAAVTRIAGRKYAVSLMAIGQKKLEGYDVAISYLHNSSTKAFYGGCNDFVLRHVSAQKKITFLHCDYQLCGADTPENAAQYARFDAIAACSNGCAESFLKKNPDLKDKVTVVPNCHRFDRIRAAAEAAPVVLEKDKINLVTVARLGKEKGGVRALRVMAALGPLQEKIHYYVIGDGAQRAQVQTLLEKEQLSSCVTLCGMLENPYGYIQAADLLLIPSYSEAAPLVIGEAAYLGTPILSTETSSAREMVEKTGFGWVCGNSEPEMEKALTELLSDPELLADKTKQMARRDLNNALAMKAFQDCLT